MFRNSCRRDGGYTFLELMMVLGVGSTLACIALASFQSSLSDIRANAALRQVRSALILAREHALSTRRPLEVRFLGMQQIQVLRTNMDGSVTEVMAAHLEGNMGFRVYPSLPDTPDAWGNAQPVGFGSTSIIFNGDGAAIDELGQPISGTVFLGMENIQLTARAVTLFGATGQVHAFRWNGAEWEQL